MHFTSAIAASILAVVAAADGTNWLGFNSGSTFADRSAKFKKDFEAEFKTAQGLEGAPGKFNAVRLYTNIQAYSQDDPIQAFEAAIETKTHLLLGIWTSGTDNIDKELNALKKAVSQYGSKFTDLVIGMSIGSEDLYRNSVTGTKNKAGVGADPDVIVNFINTYKKTFKDNALSKVPVGHVDTWDSWTNGTNKAVIDAVDWIGVDEYPFYESGKGNNISNAGVLFDRAYEATIGAAGGKPVWVTETGWPVSGKAWDQAEPNVANAKKYWDEVGCRKLFNKTPTFWYNLRDSNPDNDVKFATPDKPQASSTNGGSPKSTGVAAPSSGSGGRPGSGNDGNTNSGSGSATQSAPGSKPTKDNGAGALAVPAVAALAAFLFAL
ncbi:Putative Glucan 1,3-beta-glucosidase [[Torrubiella] hemipterigena]|uniref:Putative Glucan 1,3-beta-glucosidase n=1 Tax=[Torrubiella] hemipterigena TaxID=1531966 RepID=A0A0A1TE17_9HYPO|nr:Putative Glucan 1,3-beta-glucosidase [[Torrubiella] hemipterigena]